MGDEFTGWNPRVIRLAISVEGATEREFVNRILKPHLKTHSIEVQAIDIRGNVSLDKIAHTLPSLLSSFDFVSTFYDYYGFKRREGRSINELECAIMQLANSSQRHRFIPYIQLHEFEALIYAAPDIAVKCLQGNASDLSTMQETIRRSGSPEKINDGVTTSPSHRLKKCSSLMINIDMDQTSSISQD
jgi:Domain of unknown function (DUF4276)